MKPFWVPLYISKTAYLDKHDYLTPFLDGA